MNTQTTLRASNDLRYTIHTEDKDGNYMRITIRLNDECKNGHQDFAITADIYEKGKPKIDKYCIMGGCCHDEILNARPDLKIFVDLHLCDYKGIPMHAVANGEYHLKNGFNNEKPGTPELKTKYCEYYRVSPDQFDALNTCENELQFAIKLKELGILDQWENQATIAIKLLEEMTGKKFIVDSKKTQYHAPTPKQISEEQEKQKNGYYTAESKAKRAEIKKNELKQKLDKDRDDKIAAIVTEYNVLGQVLEIGGKEALSNCIYYNHTKKLAFNWKDYDKRSDETISKIVDKICLPAGVTIEIKNTKK